MDFDCMHRCKAVLFGFVFKYQNYWHSTHFNKLTLQVKKKQEQIHPFIALLKRISGKIQRGSHGHDVTLVLDCSERMRGQTFTTMIEAAKKYVNGMYIYSINFYSYLFHYKLLTCLLNILVLHLLFILYQMKK